MPTDEAYEAVLAELGKLHQGWIAHRESMNRAVGMLAEEVFRFEKRLDKDDADRATRQKELDAKLNRITRWQMIRLLVEAVLIVAIAAYLIGRTR